MKLQASNSSKIISLIFHVALHEGFSSTIRLEIDSIRSLLLSFDPYYRSSSTQCARYGATHRGLQEGISAAVQGKATAVHHGDLSPARLLGPSTSSKSLFAINHLPECFHGQRFPPLFQRASTSPSPLEANETLFKGNIPTLRILLEKSWGKNWNVYRDMEHQLKSTWA
jgi:hypothetical protein